MRRTLNGAMRCAVLAALCLILPTLGGCKAAAGKLQGLAAKLRGEPQVEVGAAPVPGSLRAPKYRFRAAIYHAQAPSKDVREVAKRLVGQRFQLVDDTTAADAARGATLVLTTPPLADFAPPKPDTIAQYEHGLNEDEQRAVVASQAVTVLNFQGPGGQAGAQYRAALELVQQLAGELGGYPWDDDARRAYTLAGWKELLDHWQGNEPRLQDHVTLDAYRDGELIRIVSLGMVKFGLPDLVINQVTSSESRSMGSLANIVCQTLYETGKLGKDGQLTASIDQLGHVEFRKLLLSDLNDNAVRSVELRLASAKPQDGDAHNRLLEIVFPGTVKTLQERQSAALTQLFGGHDEIEHVQHDPELLAASKRQREKAQLIGRRYKKGPPFGEELMVKEPFVTSGGGTEWMWVEVVSWKGNDIHGILKNDPFDVPALKDGSRVEVHADTIFDYLLTKKDGSTEGNETEPMIDAREKAAASKQAPGPVGSSGEAPGSDVPGTKIPAH